MAAEAPRAHLLAFGRWAFLGCIKEQIGCSVCASPPSGTGRGRQWLRHGGGDPPAVRPDGGLPPRQGRGGP
eukprot:4811489-Pyramimonas_sp.AAC.1